jgi:hypothetical protein
MNYGEINCTPIVGLSVFCQMLIAGHYLSFGPELQGNNRQKKVWGVWYIREELLREVTSFFLFRYIP